MRFLIILVFLFEPPALSASGCSEVPNVHVGPHDCCMFPKVFDDNIFVQCYREFGSFAHSDPTSSGKDGDCVAECFFNRTNILVNNVISMDRALENIKTSFANNLEFHQLFLAGAMECVSEAVRRKAQFDQSIANIPRNQGIPVCNPISTFIMTCMQTYILRVCPAARWTSSADCETIKMYANNCKYSHFT